MSHVKSHSEVVEFLVVATSCATAEATIYRRGIEDALALIRMGAAAAAVRCRLEAAVSVAERERAEAIAESGLRPKPEWVM